MRALRWHGPKHVSVDTVDDPTIQEPTDAVIRVTATAICGSDLHLLEHGATLGVLPGDILGHEAMGVVEAVGAEVHYIKPGDRVVVPFNISCGHCFLCKVGMFSQCETTQNLKGRKGAALFGYTHLYGGVAGGQAEYLRVPQAQFGPIKIGEDLPELGALLLSDVLPTAWQAVEYAQIPPGGSVAIYGLGPIGLMAVRIAKQRGAGQIIAIDSVPDRLADAKAHGATVIDYSAVDDAVDAVHELTGGRGADSVIDAVGSDADSGFAAKFLSLLKIQPDRLTALHQALGSVRRGGTVSVSGVYTGPMLNFPLGDLFDKQIALRWGQANVHAWSDGLYDLLRDGDVLDAAALITHEVPLEDAPDYYVKFRDKEPGVRKVVLRP